MSIHVSRHSRIVLNWSRRHESGTRTRHCGGWGNTVCTKGVVPGEGTLLSNAGKDSSRWPLTCPVTLLHGSLTAVTLSESLCQSLFPSDWLALSLHITPGCWSSAVPSSDRWSADTCSWVSADIAGTWTVRKCPPNWLVDPSNQWKDLLTIGTEYSLLIILYTISVKGVCLSNQMNHFQVWARFWVPMCPCPIFVNSCK